jgi:exopolysaccharide production protein ExoQ
MPPPIAGVVCVLLILGLFWVDRYQKAATSGALWIPVVWLSLACSRSVAQWLELGSPIDSPDQYLEGSPIDRLVYTGLLVVGLIVLVNRRRQVGELLRANLPILLFFLYCAVSLLWSDYPTVALKRWAKAIGDVVMVLVVLSDSEPSVAFERLLARMTYVLIPLSVLFIKYYRHLGTGYDPWGGQAHYTGVTANKNTLGVICLCFGLGSLWRFLAAYRGREGTRRIQQLGAQGVILGMVLWILWITNSMTSLSCFLMASALFLATNLRAVIRRPALVHILIAAMLTASVSVLFLGVSPGVLETMGRNPTLTDRTEVWTLLLSLVRNPLFGTGFESFWLGPRLEKMWSTYWWHPNEAHNGYIEVFLNLGWMGIALLAVVIATGYRTALAAWRSDPPKGSLRMAYFLAGVVYNFTEAAFFKMMAPVWVFFLFAIIRVREVPCPKIRPSAQNLFGHTSPLISEQARSTLRQEAF